MNAPMQTTIARCGSGVLVADGERWTFGHQPGTGGNVLVYLFGLIGTIFSVNGIAIAVTQHIGGLALLVVGLPLLATAVAIVRSRNKRRMNPTLQPIVVLDFAVGMLLDGIGRPLAPLAQVAFSAHFQLFSSARMLECRWPGGHVVVLRGDAFGGSIAPARDALRRRGLRA
jgi:hypothetical protein